MTSWNQQPKHDCAMPGCGRQIADTYLMCVSHWKQLEPATADTLWFAWRSAKTAQGHLLSIKAENRLERLLKQAVEQLQSTDQPSTPNI